MTIAPPSNAMRPKTIHRPEHGIASAISREHMANLPIRRYEGEVCLVTTTQELARARAAIEEESVVGLDTETRPAFRKGESYLPCLVQVATAQTVYLFQLRRLGVLPVVAAVLAAPHVVKAGVGVAQDLRMLRQVVPFIEQNVLDLGEVARHSGLAQTGVRNLAGIFLGYRVPKGKTTSNWAATHLSAQQIIYAATDAWVCRELFVRFQSLDLLP